MRRRGGNCSVLLRRRPQNMLVFIRPAALRIRKSAIFCGRRFLLNCPLIAVRSGRRAASVAAAIRRTRHSCKNQGLLIALYKHSISVQRIIRVLYVDLPVFCVILSWSALLHNSSVENFRISRVGVSSLECDDSLLCMRCSQATLPQGVCGE